MVRTANKRPRNWPCALMYTICNRDRISSIPFCDFVATSARTLCLSVHFWSLTSRNSKHGENVLIVRAQFVAAEDKTSLGIINLKAN